MPEKSTEHRFWKLHRLLTKPAGVAAPAPVAGLDEHAGRLRIERPRAITEAVKRLVLLRMR